RCLDFFIERYKQHFATTTLVHLGIGDDLANQTLTIIFGTLATVLHALARIAPFVRRGISLGVERLTRRLGVCQGALEIFRRLLADKDMNDRIVGAGTAGGFLDFLLRA